jgi:uncharacterized protein
MASGNMQKTLTRWLAGLLCALLLGFAGAAPSLAAPPVLASLAGDYFPLSRDGRTAPMHIYVRLPDGYAQTPERRYPVVYVLDGDSLFPILASNHLFLTYDDQLPEAIIVGIAYGGFGPDVNTRMFDFSMPEPGKAEFGGAAAFHRFLKDQVVVAVEKRYRVDPARRILFGQSRGADLVLMSALTEPSLFWGRIASNPHFSPGRDAFHSKPKRAPRAGWMIVTSGTQDRPRARVEAQAWIATAQGWGEAAPWTPIMIDSPGGTHAANSTDAYRAGMRRMFGIPN